MNINFLSLEIIKFINEYVESILAFITSCGGITLYCHMQGKMGLGISYMDIT